MLGNTLQQYSNGYTVARQQLEMCTLNAYYMIPKAWTDETHGRWKNLITQLSVIALGAYLENTLQVMKDRAEQPQRLSVAYNCFITPIDAMNYSVIS